MGDQIYDLGFLISDLEKTYETIKRSAHPGWEVDQRGTEEPASGGVVAVDREGVAMAR